MIKIENLFTRMTNYAYRKLFISSDFVKQPTSKEYGISDLFVWRNDKNWKTYFELLDVYGLIKDDLDCSADRFVIAKFFNKKGELLIENRIKHNHSARNTINIKDIMENAESQSVFRDDFGTFAIFHSVEMDLENDVFLTDRGYCGYELNNSGFRGYVHGNFDAIENSTKGMELLMGFNGIYRNYNLQHILMGPSLYEIALVNPTNSRQNIKISAKGNLKNLNIRKKINPKGIELFNFNLSEGEFLRIRIRSKMYMARPTVFRSTQTSMDVFHG
jgi:hypothetical protein